MVVVLLLIIACVLLFGAENTKSGIVSIFWIVLILGLLGSCMG